jgi:hypothetical protein
VRSGEWPAWFSFWFSGCWRALLAKGTAWAGGFIVKFFFFFCFVFCGGSPAVFFLVFLVYIAFSRPPTRPNDNTTQPAEKQTAGSTEHTRHASAAGRGLQSRAVVCCPVASSAQSQEAQ